MELQYQQQRQQTSSVEVPVTAGSGTGLGLDYDNTYNREGKVQLVVRLSSFYGLITSIRIFDEMNNMIADTQQYSDPFKRTYWIFPGNYTIRLEISGQVMDNEVEIGAYTTLGVGLSDYENLEAPRLYSSVPFSGPLIYETTTLAYLTAAREISERPRILNETRGDNGIFIFLRYPSEDLYRDRYRAKSYWKRFDLLDESGAIILQFPNFCTFSDTEGYLGTSMSLKPGSYFIRYRKRGRSRMIPLTVYEGWYTQLFMMLADEPLFGSLRIFISRNSFFEADNELNFYTDVCLDKLQNNDFMLSRYLLEQVAHGKFDAPMLGLVGTYMYLKSNIDAHDYLFDIIVGNMRNRILNDTENSPDLLALNILRDFHHNKVPEYDGVSFTKTPMLRVAYDAIRLASARSGNTIAWGSLDDYIAEKQMFDSPYNTFKAINIRVIRRAYRFESQKLDMENYLGHNIAPTRIVYYEKIQEIPAENVTESRAETTIESAFKKHGAQGAAIFRELSNQPDLKTREVSQMLSLPYNTVERIREGLRM